VFGVLGYQRLGMDQFPTMEFPMLMVTAELPGASPEGMEEDVTDVLEEQLNTIAGVRKIRSQTFPGATQITVEFGLGTNLDIAAQEVRDKVSRVRRLLPDGMEIPTVGNFNPNDQPILWIPFKSTLPAVVASEYIRREVKPIFETIPGVAGIAMFGQMDRNIRIWLDGDELRSRGLSAGDVLAALNREHIEVPGGRIESGRIEYGVKTDAEFTSLAGLRRLVVAHRNNTAIHLEDVARVEDGAQDVRVVSRYNGITTVGIGIRKQSGGNSVSIIDEVYSRLDAISDSLPDGLSIDSSVGFIDFSRSIRGAVAEAKFTLIFGAALAVLTVFVFLRRTRPTLIVAAAIPISLIASFGLVWLFGYTLNTMTLLGMTLAVGVVIDDAIVVLENIERHREAGENARDAARKGTREIAFAATAATISVAAVFLPVVFVEGIVGSFMGSFGLTVAGSVMISLFVALTLTPMLAARMPPPKERSHGSIYHRLELGFTALERSYKKVLDLTLAHRGKTVAVAFSTVGLSFAFGSDLDVEFFPSSDGGLFFAQIEAPPGSSVEATLEYLAMDEQWMLDQPEIAGLFSAVGSTGQSGPSLPNRGMMFGSLVPRAERERSVQEIIAEARVALGKIPGRVIRIFNPGAMMRGGSGGSFEIQLRGNLPLEELAELSDQMIAALGARGGLVDIDKSLKLGLPEVRVIPDREKAAALGVDGRTIASEIQLMIGGMDVGIFKEAGRRFDIRMRLEPDDRSDPDAVRHLYVRSKTGELVELGNVVHTQLGAAPSAITRTNRQRSVTISGNLAGKTLGEAIQDAEQIAAEILPRGGKLDLAGQAQDMIESARQFGVAILLGILVIYMVLAAQFESFVQPVTVLVAVALSFTGGLLALRLVDAAGLGNGTLNLFSSIGLVMLVGLVSKNSILIVEFAKSLRESGKSIVEAAQEAASLRFRAVLMTAFSFILGVLPLVVASGAGAEARIVMGVALLGGMTIATLLGVFFYPMLFVFIGRIAGYEKKRDMQQAQVVDRS